MSYIHPETAIQMINDELGCADTFMSIQSSSINNALAYLSQQRATPNSIDNEVLIEISEYLKEETGLDFNPKLVFNLLALYPVQAGNIVTDPSATDAREQMFNIIAQCYLNSWWPCYKDNIDMQRWNDALKKSFKIMHEGDTDIQI